MSHSRRIPPLTKVKQTNNAYFPMISPLTSRLYLMYLSCGICTVTTVKLFISIFNL